MPIHHPGLVPPLRKTDTRSFFSEMVPLVLRVRAEAARALGMSLEVAIAGVGTWTINLREGLVAEGASPGCDATLRLARADFEAMLRGPTDMARISRNPTTSFIGDPRALDAFALVMG